MGIWRPYLKHDTVQGISCSVFQWYENTWPVRSAQLLAFMLYSFSHEILSSTILIGDTPTWKGNTSLRWLIIKINPFSCLCWGSGQRNVGEKVSLHSEWAQSPFFLDFLELIAFLQRPGFLIIMAQCTFFGAKSDFGWWKLDTLFCFARKQWYRCDLAWKHSHWLCSSGSSDYVQEQSMLFKILYCLCLPLTDIIWCSVPFPTTAWFCAWNASWNSECEQSVKKALISAWPQFLLTLTHRKVGQTIGGTPP